MPNAPRAVSPRWDVTVFVSAMIVVTSIGYGTWMTAQAIMDGNVAGSLLRFAASTLIGTYYLILYRTAQRQRRRR
ncbi:MAG: hypothetical protein R2710_11700 [Acidimicrobiales bacterium]